MLKNVATAKIPTGYALKKRLLKLEYQTKIVGLAPAPGEVSFVKEGGKNSLPTVAKANKGEKELYGDYRVIVLRSSKFTGVIDSTSVYREAAGGAKVVVKLIKKTVFNTIEGIKEAKSAMTGKRVNGEIGKKLPVTYVYSVSPPAKNLKEQYEHLALLAPYIPMKSLISDGKTANENSSSGFIGCLLSSPSEIKNKGSELVFYYPSQLKTWLGHLVESNGVENLGLVELLQTLDLTISNLLQTLNSSLDTVCIVSNMTEKGSRS